MKLLPTVRHEQIRKKLQRRSARHAKAWQKLATKEVRGQAAIEKEIVRGQAEGLSAKDIVTALRTARLEKTGMLHICKPRGRAKGGGQSSKAKGRSAVVLVRDLLLAHCQIADEKIQPDDILVKATSQGGCDLHLSPRAASIFPFGIEVKNQENIGIWKTMAQAEMNARKQKSTPLVFFKRAGSPLYMAMKAEDFLSGLRSG